MAVKSDMKRNDKTFDGALDVPMLRERFAATDMALRARELAVGSGVYFVPSERVSDAKKMTGTVVRFMPRTDAAIFRDNARMAQMLDLPVPPVSLTPCQNDDIKTMTERPCKGNVNTIVSYPYVRGHVLHDIMRDASFSAWSDRLCLQYFTRLAVAGMADAHENNLLVSANGLAVIDTEIGASGNVLRPHKKPCSVSETVAMLREQKWHVDFLRRNKETPADLFVAQCEEIKTALRPQMPYSSHAAILYGRAQTMTSLQQLDRKSFFALKRTF